MKLQTLILAGAALLATATSASAQGAAPQREITKIAGDVYNFRNMGHNAVFMVTPAGIVLVDTIDAAASSWLKEEVKKQFNQPVRYVAYSHDHPDHASGGEVFADTALFVAHTRAKEVIVAEKRPTAVPNITFSDTMTIELGGKRVDLHYVGRNHSDNTLVAHFPAERVIFTVDWIPVQGCAHFAAIWRIYTRQRSTRCVQENPSSRPRPRSRSRNTRTGAPIRPSARSTSSSCTAT
ncbi:MAG: putative Metallo-beta-lactamase family protein [Rhodospirillales bacterium]|nr:putative Metallo-beta-lactamase family protein [Rhodospirillales bacterium]